MSQTPINPYESTSTTPAATNVRHGVLAFGVSMAVLLYIDRYAISIATSRIIRDLEIDEAQMGWAVSAFFWAYALAQVPAGALADRWGARITLTAYVAGWSLVMAAIGFVNGLVALIVLRLLLGLTQAGAYSTTAGFLKHWIPIANRGKANGAVSMGGRTGGLLAQAITPQLMTVAAVLLGSTMGDWRIVFALYAGIGLVWAFWFYRWFRNTPAEHPGCNLAERQLIDPLATEAQTTADSQSKTIQPVPPPIPWMAILTSRNVLLLSLVNFTVNVGWIFLATWLPRYLEKVHKFENLGTIGMLTAATGLAGMAGCLTGGWATDRLVRKFGIVWGRRLPGILSAMGASAAYLGCLVIMSLPSGEEGIAGWQTTAVICLLASVYFLADLFLGTTWSTYQDIGGKSVATVLGFANMCGNLGAAIFSAAIGMLAKGQQWDTVFIVSAAAFLVAMTCWFFIDPTVKLKSSGVESPKA